MTQRVARLAPFHNAKVMAVMMAVTSLIVLVPIFLLASLLGAGGSGMPAWAILIVPVFYLVAGFIGVVIGCAIYNPIVPLTGGLEFESTPADRQ